jgi:serine/threonine protein kinase/Tol biopolymer transport system component
LAAEAALRAEPFPIGTNIGRYRIVALAGSGAMGDVYRAHDRALDRDVALKVLPSDLVHDRDRVRRFAQEARAASALSHPHIVTIYEVGHARPSLNVQPIVGGRAARRHEVHYIAMEYIDGQTLREAVEEGLPQRRRVEVMTQVADGLIKAHGAGIIHRDLKPDNILIAREGYAKIVDFGLAKLVDSEGGNVPIAADAPTVALTQKGEILGTPAYMSPEQVTGGTIDQRSDVFAFGSILYELLAGHQPFDGASFVDTLHTIIHDPHAPLPETVPLELRHVVERCLRKNPADRYTTIAEVARDLRQWLHGGQSNPSGPLPILADGTAGQTRLRHDRPLIVAVAAALLIAAGGALARRYIPAASPRMEEHSILRMTTSGRVSYAAISPDGRYVAYVIGDAQGQSLWLEQVETRSRLQLAAPGDAHYAGLTFSPDGNYIFFSRYDAYPFGALFRVPILGGKPEAIVKDIDSPPALSPDSAHVAYVRDDWNRGTSTLFVANAYGSGEHVLSLSRIPHRLMSPAWSPDGKYVVAADDPKLVKVAYPSGERHELSTDLRFQRFKGVTWSPDGTLVAAAATEESGDRVRLWRIDPRNGSCRAITDELSIVQAPSVTGDGSTIAALQIVRQANLFTVDEKGTVRQLTSGVGSADGVGGLAWAGDRVVYSSATDGNPDLWSLDPRGGEPTRLTKEPSTDFDPVVTPDGARVIYRAAKGEQAALWCMRPDGSERRALTAGGYDGDFAISPDSKTLAWASLDRASNEWVLWTMPLAGGPKTRLTSRRSVLDQIRYSPDGKSILFTGYENTSVGIFRIAADGGPVMALTTHHANDANVSPDGSTIACSYGIDHAEQMGLALFPSADPARVHPLPLHGKKLRWHDNATLSFVEDAGGTSNLSLLPLGGGAPRKLTNFSDGSIADYAWSPDGHHAIVSHVVDSMDVVLIRR